MKKIYLVRHGESEANKNNCLGGKDVPLSDQGERQAAQVGERFLNLDIDTLYASDFVRAQQTAQPIAEATKLPILTEAAFGEYLEASELFGLAEDDERVIAYRTERNEKILSDPDWQYGDGETISAFMKRVVAAKQLLETCDGTNIAVVAHAFFIQSLVAAILLGNDRPTEAWLSAVKAFRHSNTGISLLTHDEGGWRVLMFNDHAHFGE